MKIKQEVMKEICQTLTERGFSNKCKFCEKDVYIISDEMFGIPCVAKGFISQDGAPTLVARCKNCGHTIFIDPYNLGVMDKIQKQLDEE